MHLVAVSTTQRSAAPDIRMAGTVHNGIDVDAYPFVPDKDPFLIYIGRANPEKGPALAIEVTAPSEDAARHDRQAQRALRTRLLG